MSKNNGEKESQKSSNLKEKFFVYLLDNKNDVVGIHESTSYPSDELLERLIKEHMEVYAKAVTAKIDKRYSL